MKSKIENESMAYQRCQRLPNVYRGRAPVLPYSAPVSIGRVSPSRGSSRRHFTPPQETADRSSFSRFDRTRAPSASCGCSCHLLLFRSARPQSVFICLLGASMCHARRPPRRRRRRRLRSVSASACTSIPPAAHHSVRTPHNQQ